MKKYIPPALFALLTLAIMLPLFKPGYLFLLDMVWPPSLDAADALQNGIAPSSPLMLALAWLSLAIPTDVIQKLILSFILFFAGFFLYQLMQSLNDGNVPASPRSNIPPFPRFNVPTFPRFNVPTFQRSHVSTFSRSHVQTFPRSHLPTFPPSHVPTFPRSDSSAIAGGIVYLLNPWVYERFLAGQWFVLLGYAVFPLMAKLFLQMLERKTRRDVVKFAVAFALYPMASLHWAYLSVFVFLTIAAVSAVVMGKSRNVSPFPRFNVLTFKRSNVPTFPRSNLPTFKPSHVPTFQRSNVPPDMKNVLKATAFITLCWLVFNSFWLLGGFLGSDQAFSRIRFDDFKAFATQTDPRVGAVGNVLSLYGFWQTSVTLPKDLDSRWFVYPAALLALSAVGAWRSWRGRDTMGKAVSLMFIPAVLVSAGYAHPFTRSIVEFLFHALPGFKGLRETEKLVGLIAFSYALLAPLGMKWIIERLGLLFSATIRKTVTAVGWLILLLIPFASTSAMLWGFQGRVIPQDYPASWFEAKQLIESDSRSGNILVFPWHGYMSASFAQYRIVFNPASGFFGRSRVVAGKTIENVYLKETDQGLWDEKVFRLIHGFETLDENIEFVRSNGITHIVLLKEADWREQYGFLETSERLERLFDSPEIAVFGVR